MLVPLLSQSWTGKSRIYQQGARCRFNRNFCLLQIESCPRSKSLVLSHPWWWRIQDITWHSEPWYAFGRLLRQVDPLYSHRLTPDFHYFLQQKMNRNRQTPKWCLCLQNDRLETCLVSGLCHCNRNLAQLHSLLLCCSRQFERSHLKSLHTLRREPGLDYLVYL